MMMSKGVAEIDREKEQIEDPAQCAGRVVGPTITWKGDQHG